MTAEPSREVSEVIDSPGKGEAEEEGRDKIFDDVSDTHSVMSMGNTMSNMNFIPLDTDLDNLIDQMLSNANPGHLANLEM